MRTDEAWRQASGAIVSGRTDDRNGNGNGRAREQTSEALQGCVDGTCGEQAAVMFFFSFSVASRLLRLAAPFLLVFLPPSRHPIVDLLHLPDGIAKMRARFDAIARWSRKNSR